ncbi:uncharacterized protein LOC105217767 [Zeugodacus cucurbitae]|uniref:uncharacterized protein LOC105217767 n=1 Tax=Zeugodacus cucurbitae TaxID=28588 RepID=UPI0023D942DE|nr:uncharacterized protein LOC105217767 [Zeugodacus cucurbitae]
MHSSRLSPLILLAIAVLLQTTPETECVKVDGILNFLEELRVRMCHPIPQLGLPALDPFHISHVETEMNNKYLVDFSGSVTNFNLTGLSDFDIKDLQINTLKKSIIDINLPMTAFTSIYTAKGSLAYILNLAGDGNADAHIKNFNLRISFNLRIGKFLSIRNFSIKITVGEIYMDFENLLEEERINNFLHALVNELGLELLGDLWTDEKDLAEQYIQDRINSLIGQYTLADIIKIIGGSGDGEPIFGNGPPGDCKDDNTFN